MNLNCSKATPIEPKRQAWIANEIAESPQMLPALIDEASRFSLVSLRSRSSTLASQIATSYDRQQTEKFETLLANMLASLLNTAPLYLEAELTQALLKVCGLLALKGAAYWRPSSKYSFTILHYAAKAKPVCPDGSHELTGQPASDDTYAKSLDESPANAHFPWVTRQLMEGKTVAFSRLEELPEEAAHDKAWLARLHPGPMMIVPFVSKGEVIGAVSFNIPRQTTCSQTLLNKLRLVAGICASAVVRTRSEEKLFESQTEIALLKDRLPIETDYFQNEVKISHAHDQVIGRSQCIRRVLHQVEQVAATESVVLVYGETGTGKELVAQEIHRLSARKDRNMVLVNCAALPATLVESELFGRERGAYTGASSSQIGRFEIANGSTLFLDEVGELPLEIQAKLLRVLQQGEFQRLGNPRTFKVNVRIIAATNRDLTADVGSGRFREDLYYRLKVFPIEVPPLRDRIEDIPPLVFAFMEEFSKRMGKNVTKISRKAMEALQSHRWSGNIRELRNVIEHSLILSSGDTLNLSFVGESPSYESRTVTLAQVERDHIIKTLEVSGWRIKGPHGAARKLDLEPSTLYSRMQKLGIPNRRQKDEVLT